MLTITLDCRLPLLTHQHSPLQFVRPCSESLIVTLDRGLPGPCSLIITLQQISTIVIPASVSCYPRVYPYLHFFAMGAKNNSNHKGLPTTKKSAKSAWNDLNVTASTNLINSPLRRRPIDLVFGAQNVVGRCSLRCQCQRLICQQPASADE